MSTMQHHSRKPKANTVTLFEGTFYQQVRKKSADCSRMTAAQSSCFSQTPHQSLLRLSTARAAAARSSVTGGASKTMGGLEGL